MTTLPQNMKARKLSRSRMVPIDSIVEAVCEALDIEPDGLRRPASRGRLTLAREMIAYIARSMTHLSYPDIADCICGKRSSHVTWLQAHQRAEDSMVLNCEFRREVEGLMGMLRWQHA